MRSKIGDLAALHANQLSETAGLSLGERQCVVCVRSLCYLDRVTEGGQTLPRCYSCKTNCNRSLCIYLSRVGLCAPDDSSPELVGAAREHENELRRQGRRRNRLEPRRDSGRSPGLHGNQLEIRLFSEIY